MVQGRKDNTALASGYEKNEMHGLAEAFLQTARTIQHEGTDLFMQLPSAMLEGTATNEALKSFFVNESYDPTNMTPEEIQEHVTDMEQLYANDREAMMEAAIGQNVNPMIGMSLPLHKFILMNMVFDKGAIPKYVAGSRSFTISMEYRYLIDTEGNRLDMFKDQNLMTAAMNKSMNVTEFELPSIPFTDDNEIVNTYLNGVAGVDHMSYETYVTGVKVSQYIDEGDLLPDENGYIRQGNPVADSSTKGTKDVWVRTKFPFTPTYDSFGRAMMAPFSYQTKQAVTNDEDSTTTIEIVTLKDTITGRFENDRLEIQVMRGVIKGIKVTSKLDSTLNTQPLCTVDWRSKDHLIEIEDFPAISTAITPQETKDVAGLYNVNQVTKYMSLMKTAMANYKDDTIKAKLDESYETMDPASKTYDTYDFAPREGYMGDHVQWRKDTFFDKFDLNIQRLLQVLNDPNVTISVFGDPFIVARLIPDTVSFQSPSNIGPVVLDYTKTVFTNATRRQYQFIGSDKLRGTSQLIIILCPKGSDRIIYRIYDYQMYLSNEIKNPTYMTLPSLHAFERWKFVEFQPVQGRMDILHIDGLTDHYDVVQTREVPAQA